MKFNLFYSEAEWEVLDNKAKEHGFSDTQRFLRTRIIKMAKSLPEAENCKSQKKSRRMIRMNDKDVEARLSCYAKRNGISVTVLARRLSADPLILLALLEVVGTHPPAPSPESL